MTMRSTRTGTAGTIPALLGGIVLVAGLALCGAGRAVASAADDPAATDGSAIHWQTPRVDLRADGLTLSVGDQTISAEGADVTVSEHVRAPRSWDIVAEWTADDHLVQLALHFRSKNSDWYLETINGVVSGLAMSDGRSAYALVSFGAANPTRTPLGEVFSGDLRRSRESGVVPCQSTGVEEAISADTTSVLSIEGLRLSVEPRGRSLFERALGFLGLDAPPGLDHFFEVACGRPPMELAPVRPG